MISISNTKTQNNTFIKITPLFSCGDSWVDSWSDIVGFFKHVLYTDDCFKNTVLQPFLLIPPPLIPIKNDDI